MYRFLTIQLSLTPIMGEKKHHKKHKKHKKRHNLGVTERYDQGELETHQLETNPYNKKQWTRLHIGSQLDQQPASATRAARNNHTLNDPAQSGAYPAYNYYTYGQYQKAETGERQYAPGQHEFSTTTPAHHSRPQETILHSYDTEHPTASFGHNVAAAGTRDNERSAFNDNDPAKTVPVLQQPLPNIPPPSALNIDDLREMYTLYESIPNFLTLARTAKQNFMHSFVDREYLE